MPDEIKAMIEAALFISSRPISVEEFARICNSGNLGTIRKIIDELQKEYAERDSAIRIVNEKSGYSMQLRSDLEERLTYLAPCSDIPKPTLKTLALIAHQQPIKQSELVTKLGTTVYDHVKQLLAAGFIEAKKAGSTKILSTTSRFNEYFRIRNIKELKCI